ncbi:DUF4386 domain-containing protein [Dactylosporangium sp. AC04546]|uniref:DUF4386 domain-containing protein n=1 Tax=Dactylosporangium sp. AC04546 TaxID=2862460 RepID=UPI001EE00447|nr:DUF4386 domain-containing protein [Dactylosporangium sp. AC04546]WVK80876.1 DUF4386 domain-containing protein [Dactylosporangium sp. AC04546]
MTIDSSQRTAARVAGFVLLLLMAAGFFSQAYVPGQIIVAGDAAATARNIVASEQLFRIGVAVDVLIFAADIVMAVAFYVLLKKVNPGLALLALLWRTVQVAIMAMNGLSFLTASSVLNGSDTAGALSPDLQELANTYVGAHTAGFNLGLVFLALGNGVFAYLLFTSNYIPRALSAWGILAYVVMAVGNLATIVLAGAEDTAGGVMLHYMPAFFFEVIAGGWLLFKGVRAATPAEPAPERA